jgi:membrane-associated phospholipid phosphatase
MSKIFSILDGFTRAYPLIIIFHTFLNGILHNNSDEFHFGIFLLISDVFNHFIKSFLFKPLIGNKKIPLLGFGTRPQNMNCGLFIDNKEINSYGLPSGHSQIAWLFTTYRILNLEEKNFRPISLLLIGLATLISYSRVRWAKCHTIQQVILGAGFGIILGIIYNKNKSMFIE